MLLLALVPLAGCETAEQKGVDAAVAQAKQQAASTGVAQQVVWTENGGITRQIIVQPSGQASAPTIKRDGGPSTIDAESMPNGGASAHGPIISPVSDVTGP